MDLTPVTSSNIQAIGYEAEDEILQVVFLNGSTYEYYNVPEEVYQAFMTAPSKGKFLWESFVYD
ncbi:MAG: KTSC domain-containing protein [Planctomycetota bacterium]